jgi:hypothetical protein
MQTVTIEKVKEIKGLIGGNGLNLTEAEFQEKWRASFGEKTKMPKLSESKIAMKLLSRLSDEDFAHLLNTGELPAVELTSAEMEALKGGLTPAIAVLGIVSGVLWVGSAIAAHYGY